MSKPVSGKNAEAVRRLIGALSIELLSADAKPAVADLARLSQLERELEPDEPREVIVRWVEPFETESAIKE